MNELYHHGIKGQKWGVRRYQEGDGNWTKIGLIRRAQREGWGYRSDKSNQNNSNKIIKTSKPSSKDSRSQNENDKKTKTRKRLSKEEFDKLIARKDRANEEAHKHHFYILNKVKRSEKSAAEIEYEEQLKKPFRLTTKQKKAIAIGAAVAITALAIYGVYKYNSINNNDAKFNETLVNRLLKNTNSDASNSAKSDFLKEAFGDHGDFHAFDDSQKNKQIIDNMLTKSSSEWWLGLSESEKHAVVDYTGSSFSEMNMALWGAKGGNIHDYASSEAAQKIIDCNSALKKASFPTDMVTTHGLGTYKACEFLNCTKDELREAANNPSSSAARKLLGAVNTNHGFVSTTTCASGGYDGTVQYKILTPKGAHAAYVEHISEMGDLPFKTELWDGKSTGKIKSIEFETVFAAGSKFKTKGIQYNEIEDTIEVALEYILEN